MGGLYLVHPLLDALVMGGASIALYAACRLFEGGAGGAAMGSAWETVAVLVAALNGAHFAATSYRLYRSPGARAQFPLTAALVPAVVLAGVAASFVWPLLIAPYFIKLFLLWSPYHYSGQTVGLSALYARRAGGILTPSERKALGGFVFGTFLASVARAEVQLNRFDYLGVAYPSFGLPSWVATACLAVMAACGAAFLYLAARRPTRLPWIVFVAPAAQFTWFVLGPRSALFYPLVPLFHGAQYLFVSWFLHLQERRLEGATSAPLETLRWGGWSLAGYLVLFLALPKLLAAATGVTFLFATAVFTGGVQLHHFFVDGVIWRLRAPRLSKAMTASLSLTLLFLATGARAAPALRPERVVLRTGAGDLVIALYSGAPRHAKKLLSLFEADAYAAAPVVKVDPTRFIAFAGAPGAKTSRLPVESGGPHRAGVVAMAHQPGDPDTNETAFVILFADIPAMDGRFSAVGEVVGGREVLEALKSIRVDGDSRPTTKFEITGASVLASDALLSKTALRGPDLAALGRDETSAKRRVLIVLGALLIVAGLVLWLKGTSAWSSAGLLVCLAGYLSLFAALADLSASSPWLAVLLFAATVGVFRLMSRFER